MTKDKDPIYGESLKDFEIGDRIGKGGFGEVFKARCKKLGFEKYYVAIKRISKSQLCDPRYKDRTQNEIDIHSKLPTHPGFVTFHTSFEDKKYWYLVMELCDRGSLEEYVKHKTLRETEIVELMKKVIDAVNALHQSKVIHRDISMKNLLLTKDYEVKIADFGFAAKLKDKNEKVNSVLGTPNFMAPEVVKHESYDICADYWSVGCVLYTLLYGSSPINKKERYKDWQLKFPDNASSEAKELLMAMLNTNPTQRISLKEALKYDFFKRLEKSAKISQNHRHIIDTDSGMSSFSNSKSKISTPEYDYRSSCHKPPKKFEEKYAPITKRLDHIIPQKQKPEHVSYQERYESQYDTQIKKRIEHSLHPVEPQYLTARNINSQITNSDVDSVNSGGLSIKPSSKSECRNTYRQNRYGHYPVKDSSCSLDQCYTSSNTGLQKLNCYQQVRSDSHQSVGEHTTENEESFEPLNTARLESRSKEIKKICAMMSILDDGQVCLEVLKIRDGVKYVRLVYLISGDGLKIKVCKPQAKITFNPDEPLRDWKSKDKFKRIREISFEDLCVTDMKWYQKAKTFVNNVREITEKVTVRGEHASCSMMENTPDPDYVVKFYDGFTLRKRRTEITYTDKNGCAVTRKDVRNFMLKVFENMKKDCEIYEHSTEQALKCGARYGFPVIVGKKPGGRKPSRKASIQDNNKENMSTNFSLPPSLNGLNCGIKYDESIENSVSSNIFQYTSTPNSSKYSVTTSSFQSTANFPPYLRNSKLSSTEYPHYSAFVNYSRDI